MSYRRVDIQVLWINGLHRSFRNAVFHLSEWKRLLRRSIPAFHISKSTFPDVKTLDARPRPVAGGCGGQYSWLNTPQFPECP